MTTRTATLLLCAAGVLLLGQAGPTPPPKPTNDLQALPGPVMPMGMEMTVRNLSDGGAVVRFPIYALSFGRHDDTGQLSAQALIVSKLCGDQTALLLNTCPGSSFCGLVITIPQYGGHSQTLSCSAFFQDIRTKVVQRTGGGTAQIEELVFVVYQQVTYTDASGTATR